MRRIIELVSGLAATTIGLIGVVTQVRAIAYPYNNSQLVAFPTVGLNTWSEISGEIDLFMFLLAILLVGVSIGAYLHAVHQSTWGLAILWISTASLIVAVAFATLTPPSFGYTGGSLSAAALDVVSPALAVLTVVLTAVAAMAAIGPRQPGFSLESPPWLRRLDRIVHPHAPAQGR